MKFIWISVTAILGLLMFMVVKQHFIWAAPYLVLHLSLITILGHTGQLNIGLPKAFIPFIFIALQLVYSIYFFTLIGEMGLDEENYDKQIKFNLIRIGVLLVEYPLLLEFLKKPKFIRY